MAELPFDEATVGGLVEKLLPAVADWYESQRSRRGAMNTNVIFAGLYVTEHMRRVFPLAESDYLTDTQVRGAGLPLAKAILKRHGEERPIPKEAGRTSRKTAYFAKQLATVLNEHERAEELTALDDVQRDAVARRLQAWFVEKMRLDYFDKQRISAEINPNKPVRLAVRALIEAASRRGGNAAGAVAQHLVGAKLSLRFPEVEISNESYTTADHQTDRPGDFHVGDTAFHVTMNPNEALFTERCQSNLNHNYRPQVLVPEHKVLTAREMASNAGISNSVVILSIEDFVGTNIEEIATFEGDAIRAGLRQLLERYNERVAAVEPDPSLQIEIPKNL
ncbi:hypothetical protein LI90_388 [Carbonactinospora thermoautotrophica]|uniref:DUF4928 domain-containing protein n=1 Tax=Carbonactinospora thermoautotrophica TaxID=1469144 RepID=A0A132MM11_9ACTN|nr:DUF4928 family protein [Carbonactinospora thermoautotrophica]KWW98759.1 hypothetical protein LI90_388 [Carbonactinospora thermoautotrophica]